jgi:hypothetical protein
MQCGGFPTGLFVDATRLYWTAGGRQAVESSGLLGGPACTDAYLEIGESQGGLLFHTIRAVGSSLFWSNGEQLKTADISDCEASGSCVGNNRSVSGTQNFDLITAFTIAGDNVFFIGDEGGVFKAPKAINENGDPNPATALARDQMQFPIDPNDLVNVGSMVASDTYVYWTTSDCKIMSLPL